VCSFHWWSHAIGHADQRTPTDPPGFLCCAVLKAILYRASHSPKALPVIIHYSVAVWPAIHPWGCNKYPGMSEACPLVCNESESSRLGDTMCRHPLCTRSPTVCWIKKRPTHRSTIAAACLFSLACTAKRPNMFTTILAGL
jgi:hypothetical protein